MASQLLELLNGPDK